MFIQLYRGIKEALPGETKHERRLLEAHPMELTALMEFLWKIRETEENPDVASFPLVEFSSDFKDFIPWHLIYAYVIENTRIYEIFERVVFEYLHGERLGFPKTRPGTNLWLRTAEELFYKNSSHYFVQSIVSNIRPDIRASRRNAYYRMFGLDLNHGAGGAASYPYHKPSAANREFVPLFEEFLSEVWVGIANATNAVGPNPTDDSKIVDLIRRIRELLTTRRQGGDLTREEFFHVATMSWMHLTLYVDDYDVVRDMGISAQSPAERLRQMGERVGYPAHPKADAFFQMAEDISSILIFMESDINGPVRPQNFYAPTGALREAAENVVSQWSVATGKDLKSLKVRSGATAMALR